MDWVKAKSNLDKYYYEYPNHTSTYLLKAFYLRWKHYPILEKDTELYFNYLSILDSAESSAELVLKRDKIDLEQAYYKMTSHIMRAELHATNEDIVKAAMEGKNAFGIIKKGFEWCEQNPEFYISTGLYNYYVEFYRDKGFFYQSLLWPFSKGDRSDGLKYLKKGSGLATFSKVECEIYLAHLNFKMQNNPGLGLTYIQNLRQKFPNNTKFAEMEIENLIALNRIDETFKPLALLKNTNDDYTLLKIMLFESIAQVVQNRQLDAQKRQLQKSIKELDELDGDQEHYLSLAYLYLGKAEKALKNEGDAESHFDKAKKYAKYPYIKEKLEEIESL